MKIIPLITPFRIFQSYAFFDDAHSVCVGLSPSIRLRRVSPVSPLGRKCMEPTCSIERQIHHLPMSLEATVNECGAAERVNEVSDAG